MQVIVADLPVDTIVIIIAAMEQRETIAHLHRTLPL